MSLLKQLSFILAVAILSVAVGYLALAWTDAPGVPPDCPVDYPGCNTPLNVSITAQAKQGALVLGANPAVETGLIVQHGKVGIGTTTPSYTLDISGSLRVSWSCGEEVTFVYKGSQVTYGTVESQGKCWMDRNLGASQVATAYNDSAAYGDLFQWGRLDDSHQTRTSGTTSTRSSTDNPGHSSFITAQYWRNPTNDNLWQGVSGINNPCPSGWRLPTSAELSAEMSSWSEPNYNGAFASPLKLTAGGNRYYNTGALQAVGTAGNYWGSTVVSGGVYARWEIYGWAVYTSSVNASGHGYSVRCVLDPDSAGGGIVAGTIESISGGFKFPDATVQTTAAAGGVPSGMIAMFDTSCPSGWTRFSSLDDRFPQGANTYGGTGGLINKTTSGHQHDTPFSQPLPQPPSVPAYTHIRVPYTAPFGLGGTSPSNQRPYADLKGFSTDPGTFQYMKTSSSSDTIADIRPPYLNVIWCKKD